MNKMKDTEMKKMKETGRMEETKMKMIVFFDFVVLLQSAVERSVNSAVKIRLID